MAGFTAKLSEGLRYAFGDLFNDMAGWMAVGLLAGGALTVFLPSDFFTNYLNGGITTMFLMLAVGLPMYICASASTPIAAAMIMKGLSPGAALVFLLAGPATNIGSMAIIRRFMGGRALFIYLFAISVCSIALGLALDVLYSAMGINPAMSMGAAGEIVPPWIKTASALVLAALFARYLLANGFSAVSAASKRWKPVA
ncbi:MAG: permease [Nitrospinae bacterium]|nr:permease [Nitrospinota bacterium]